MKIGIRQAHWLDLVYINLHVKNYQSIPKVSRVMVFLLPHFGLSSASFVLRFYGPVNPMGSCQTRSVYLTTRLLGRLSPLSG